MSACLTLLFESTTHKFTSMPFTFYAYSAAVEYLQQACQLECDGGPVIVAARWTSTMRPDNG